MKKALIEILVVALGGSLGAVARFAVARLVTWSAFPLGTLIINITGSCFLGWFLAKCSAGGISDTTRLAIGTGFVGAYTTFSTYMFESDSMIRDGAGIRATVYLVSSIVLGLIAVRAGFILGGGGHAAG
jgi:CrcB protein